MNSFLLIDIWKIIIILFMFTLERWNQNFIVTVVPYKNYSIGYYLINFMDNSLNK